MKILNSISESNIIFSEDRVSLAGIESWGDDFTSKSAFSTKGGVCRIRHTVAIKNVDAMEGESDVIKSGPGDVDSFVKSALAELPFDVNGIPLRYTITANRKYFSSDSFEIVFVICIFGDPKKLYNPKTGALRALTSLADLSVVLQYAASFENA